MWSMAVQRIHLIIGISISLLVIALVVLFGPRFWRFETTIIGDLLSFAGVPHRVFKIGEPVSLLKGFPVYYRPGGLTFGISVHHTTISAALAIAIVIILIIASILVYKFSKITLPFKVMFLFIAALAGVTTLYNAFVSPIPPHALDRLTIDWQFSGIFILTFITIIFAFAIFPVKGPIWLKLFWLSAVLLYSVIWNVTRLSVVLATLYHLGTLPFLMLHYMGGVFIDFIYIVAFYSLALASLAKYEVSEVGW
jgi:hypothetical protein